MWTFAFLLSFGIAWSQNSVLQSGKWYKVAVEKNGVYKIDVSLLKQMGFDPSKVNPRNIKVFGNEGGMLPQANSASRPFDLQETSIFVKGEEDGVFNSGDYILFYAQGADKAYFDVQRNMFYYEQNLYSDKNYYFITVGDTPGKRVGIIADAGPGHPVVNQFENFVYYETDQHNELKSGREWYGEQFDLVTEFSKSFDIPNIVNGTSIRLISDVMAKSFTGSSFTVSINGNQVAQQTVPSIPNLQYGIKGRDRRDTLTTSAAAVNAVGQTSQTVSYKYVKGSGVSVGYLDNFLLQVTQQLALYGQQTSFRSTASLQQPVTQFEIDKTTSQSVVWDVTNPYEPAVQLTTFNASKTTFAAPTTSLKEFVVFGNALPAPELIERVNNQNLKGEAVPDHVIVVHPDFLTEAQRLAQHRSNHSNLSVLVVTTEQVFNEFSSGRPDVTAIRDLAKFMYDKAPGKLKSLLLFGKGSYDYKDRIVKKRNFVPIYESRNSLHPLPALLLHEFSREDDQPQYPWCDLPRALHSMCLHCFPEIQSNHQMSK